MITPAQCRMGRAALDWTLRDLADKAQVHHITICKFEGAAVRPHQSTLASLRRAIEAAGVQFGENGSLCPPVAEC